VARAGGTDGVNATGAPGLEGVPQVEDPVRCNREASDTVVLVLVQQRLQHSDKLIKRRDTLGLFVLIAYTALAGVRFPAEAVATAALGPPCFLSSGALVRGLGGSLSMPAHLHLMLR
jgi:hypothetical protein